MPSSSGPRSGLLTAGGILSIVGGVLGLVVAVPLFWSPLALRLGVCGKAVWDLALTTPLPSIESLALGGFIATTLGIFAILGGVSAIRRRSYGLSLGGAICALPLVILVSYLVGVPAIGSLILGILAVIFVGLGKREFGAKVKEDAI